MTAMLTTEIYCSCGCGRSSCFYCFEETFVASLQLKQDIPAIEDPYSGDQCDLSENETEHKSSGDKCDLAEVKSEIEHGSGGDKCNLAEVKNEIEHGSGGDKCDLLEVQKEEECSTNRESCIYESECKNMKLEHLAVNHPNKQWIPPKSPYNLIQESLFHDPWQLLVATIFLNRTNAKVALPLFWKFIDKWSTPHRLRDASIIEIAVLMKPLGLNVRRALQIKQFTYDFLHKDWQYPRQLHGIGQYGDDSYRIFCVNEWKSVQPKDKELRKYVAWLWENHHGLKL